MLRSLLLNNKIMKRNIFGALSLITLMVLSACVWQADIKSTSIALDEETAHYNFHAKYPQFDIATLDEAISNKVNGYFEKCQTESAKQAKEEWFRPFEVVINSKDTVVDNRYVSANVQCYYFAGGAHGMTLNNSYNYDAKTKQFIDINQLLTGADTTQLVQLVKTKLKQHIGAGNFVDEGITGVPSLSKFMIFDQGIQFLFDPYEVAAYVHGVVSILVKYEEYPFNIELKK